VPCRRCRKLPRDCSNCDFPDNARQRSVVAVRECCNTRPDPRLRDPRFPRQCPIWEGLTTLLVVITWRTQQAPEKWCCPTDSIVQKGAFSGFYGDQIQG
jgi:hypothetical protein